MDVTLCRAMRRLCHHRGHLKEDSEGKEILPDVAFA